MWGRKGKRPARSTFTAELHNLSEVAEECMLFCGFIEEAFYGAMPSATIATKLDKAELKFQICLFIDAKSVFVAISNSDVKPPTESQLLYGVKALQDHMLRGRVSRLYWVDTIDMLADALTTGKIARLPLLQALRLGRWTLTKPENVVFWPIHRPGTQDTQPPDPVLCCLPAPVGE